MAVYVGVFEELFREQLPALWEHFRRVELTTDMFLFDWVITLFSRGKCKALGICQPMGHPIANHCVLPSLALPALGSIAFTPPRFPASPPHPPPPATTLPPSVLEIDLCARVWDIVLQDVSEVCVVFRVALALLKHRAPALLEGGGLGLEDCVPLLRRIQGLHVDVLLKLVQGVSIPKVGARLEASGSPLRASYASQVVAGMPGGAFPNPRWG
jgi:hypothetical protein